MPPIHRVPEWEAAAFCMAVLTTPALAQGAASREFETRFAAARQGSGHFKFDQSLTFNDFEGVLATVAEVSGPN